MRNGRRHIFPRRVQVKVGQGVVIDIEPVRCDIGRITASENGKVDHRELLHVQMRGDFRMVLFLGPQGFLYLEYPSKDHSTLWGGTHKRKFEWRLTAIYY